MTQREKPGIDVDELCATLGVSREGALVSGGMIEDFRRGWAKYIMSHGSTPGKGHYFTRGLDNIGEATSACGLTVDVRWLYGIGNIPKCQRCRRAIGEIKQVRI